MRQPGFHFVVSPVRVLFERFFPVTWFGEKGLRGAAAEQVPGQSEEEDGQVDMA